MMGNNKRFKKHILLSVLGLLLMASGLIVVKSFPELQPMIKVIPFLCFGIGAGIFGENLGSAVNTYIFLKNPLEAKKFEIEEKDERNTIIKNKAKAKAYDLMLMMYGALMLSFALLGVDLYLVVTLAVMYLIINMSNMYYLLKFQKEM